MTTPVQFAVRLNKRMADLGMSQSDVAREAWGEQDVKRQTRAGAEYTSKVAKGRESMRLYASGKRLPTDQKLRDIAKALKCSPADLVPPGGDNPRDGVALQPVDDEGMVQVDLSLRLPAKIAQAVAALVEPWQGRG